MAYCIKLSEFDESKQKIVSGPWKGSCEDCSFPSSSSSGSSSSSDCLKCLESKDCPPDKPNCEDGCCKEKIECDLGCFEWYCDGLEAKCRIVLQGCPSPDDPCIEAGNCCEKIGYLTECGESDISCGESSSSSTPPSSSSSSVYSNFYVCSKGSCIRLEDLGEGENYDIGPFFGDSECYRCYSSSSSTYEEFASSSSSEESSSSSEESSSSSEECPPCKMLQCPPGECCCWKILQSPKVDGQDVDKKIGVPKYLNLALSSNSLCLQEYVFKDDANPDGFYDSRVLEKESCIIDDSIEYIAVNVVKISPEINLKEIDGEGLKVQVWDSEDCDLNGEPLNPTWMSDQPFTVVIGDQEYSGSISFSERGPRVEIQDAQFDTERSQLVIFGGMEIIEETYSLSIESEFPWDIRFRREYNDWTLSETQVLKITANRTTSNNQNDTSRPIFFPEFPNTLDANLLTVSEPTCREPEESKFCSCLNLDQYNVIELDELDSYEVPKDGCDGNPLDIDLVCGRAGDDFSGSNPVPGGVTMYYAPYPDTVPVINNMAYDVTSLPTPPLGKINVIKIRKEDSRNEIRSWVCANLKFATIRGDWRTDPVLGPGGPIGSDFTSPEQNINFNWPYNDLYFTEGCPGGDTVNLIPC